MKREGEEEKGQRVREGREKRTRNDKDVEERWRGRGGREEGDSGEGLRRWEGRREAKGK